VIITTDPSLDLQTHSEKLVHSAAVNLNVEFGSFKVLSELCLKHGITPGACMLSDKTDFKIDRLFYKSNDPTDHRTGGTGGRTGDTVYVKLLRLHSRSERKLVAVKQVNNIDSRVAGEYLHSPDVSPRSSEVETDFTPELSFRP